MPKCEIRDNSTGQTIIGYNFGGPEIYKAGNDYVYAPAGGTSVSISEGKATLNPLGNSIIIKSKWEVVSHQGIGTPNWRVTVKNTSTNETKSDVYPFNLNGTGNVYELKCQPGTWVMASCGGYKIESSWDGQQTNQVFKLKGTNEIITIVVPNYTYTTNQVGGSYSSSIGGTSPYYLQNERSVQRTLLLNDCSISSELIPINITIVAFGSDFPDWGVYNSCKGITEERHIEFPMYYEIVEYPEELVKFLINKENKYAKLIKGYFDIPTPSPVISFTPATYHVGASWWETTSTPASLMITLGKRVRLINYQSFPFADRAFIESLPGVLN